MLLDGHLPKITTRISLNNFHKMNNNNNKNFINDNNSEKYKLFNKTSGHIGFHGFNFVNGITANNENTNKNINSKNYDNNNINNNTNSNFFKDKIKLKVKKDIKDNILFNLNRERKNHGNENLLLENILSSSPLEKNILQDSSNKNSGNSKKKIHLFNKNSFNTKFSLFQNNKSNNNVNNIINNNNNTFNNFNVNSSRGNNKIILKVKEEENDINKESLKEKVHSSQNKREAYVIINKNININNINKRSENKKIEVSEENNDSFINELNDILSNVKGENINNNIGNINNNPPERKEELEEREEKEDSDDDDDKAEPDPRINFEQISRLNKSRPQTSYGGLNARKKNLQSALQNNRQRRNYGNQGTPVNQMIFPVQLGNRPVTSNIPQNYNNLKEVKK